MSDKQASQYGCGTLIVIAIAALIWWSVIDDATDDSPPSPFRQAGYMQASNMDRVFTVEMRGDVDANAARRHAQAKPNTPGRMTSVYFYPRGAKIPADGITRSENVFAANKVLYETAGLSKWRYAYMLHRNGRAEFVDCQAEPGNDLCRKID